MLAEAENAAPVAPLDVAARNLCRRFGARSVSFLFVDILGRQIVPATTGESAAQRGRSAAQIPSAGSLYDEVPRTQKPVRTQEGEPEHRVLARVTNRGDTIGVLELFVRRATEDVLRQVAEVAHALAYIIITDRRFTDLYHWGSAPPRSPVAAVAVLARPAGSHAHHHSPCARRASRNSSRILLNVSGWARPTK